MFKEMIISYLKTKNIKTKENVLLSVGNESIELKAGNSINALFLAKWLFGHGVEISD